MAVETPPPRIGASCPDFRLPAVDGMTVARDDLSAAPILVVMFICNHCPYVKAVEDRLIALARAFEPRGVRFVAICSNDAESYPDDAFDKLRDRWREKGYGFPYLHDASQEVARAFGAVCTPDIFVYDRARRLAYRGRIDDSWKDPGQVTRRELGDALEALVAGKTPEGVQRPSMGCSIKWRQQAA
jgi:peroxiredoxin